MNVLSSFSQKTRSWILPWKLTNYKCFRLYITEASIMNYFMKVVNRKIFRKFDFWKGLVNFVTFMFALHCPPFSFSFFNCPSVGATYLDSDAAYLEFGWNYSNQKQPPRDVLNPFHATDLFLYLLKTLENLWFSDVFRGHRKRQWHKMG